MRSGSITGCCNGSNFYNLGGAHGHRTATNQEEFESWLADRTRSSINIAITNHEQSRTRSYLEAAGWKTDKVGHLWISTISSADFNKILVRVNERKIEEHKKAQERKRAQEAERQAIREKLKFSTGFDDKVYKGKVTLDDIRTICEGRAPYTMLNIDNWCRNKRELINQKYKINLRSIGFYSTHQLRQAVYNAVYKARKNAGIL